MDGGRDGFTKARGGWRGKPMPNQIYQCHVCSNSTLQPANSHWDFGFEWVGWWGGVGGGGGQMGVRNKPQFVRDLNQSRLTNTSILPCYYNVCIRNSTSTMA